MGNSMFQISQVRPLGSYALYEDLQTGGREMVRLLDFDVEKHVYLIMSGTGDLDKASPVEIRLPVGTRGEVIGKGMVLTGQHVVIQEIDQDGDYVVVLQNSKKKAVLRLESVAALE